MSKGGYCLSSVIGRQGRRRAFAWMSLLQVQGDPPIYVWQASALTVEFGGALCLPLLGICGLDRGGFHGRWYNVFGVW